MHQPTTPEVRQAGAVPYRRTSGRIEVALITNRTGERWLIPKGHLEPGLSAPESAAREAFEEAGLLGVIGVARLGRFQYVKRGLTWAVDLYPLRVTTEMRSWPEQQRRRGWFTLGGAAKRVAFDGLGECLLELPARLAGPCPV
ncbi:MAG: NUDIX hydrolase [Planctomycetota bacterium]|jgi:8-oxo-dGTP pyrophosphatase MutT (NUDIX family)